MYKKMDDVLTTIHSCMEKAIQERWIPYFKCEELWFRITNYEKETHDYKAVKK